MIRLIEILWLALIPLFVYAMWRLFRIYKAKRGQPVTIETRENVILAWTIIASLACMAAGMVYLGVKSEPGAPGGGVYIPPRIENGVITPGRIEQGK